MKYRMNLFSKAGVGAGDTVCFIAACREFARKTESTAFVSICGDIVEAYNDLDHLRFGTEGMFFGVTCPEEAHRLKEPMEYGNYYGTYLAAMGIHPGGLPRLELPVFPKGDSYDVIQPFSVWAKNPPVEYVQRLVDAFREITGRELFVVGHSNTSRKLKNVRYDLLGESLPRLMEIIQNARFVMTARSLSANLAAGYGRPSFVWVPDDGENWNLNYPDWPRETVRHSQGAEESISRLSDFLIGKGNESVRNNRVVLEGGSSFPNLLEKLGRFKTLPKEPIRLPIISIVVETRPEMMDRIRQITDWHRKWFTFHREIVVSNSNPGIPGAFFVNCGNNIPHSRKGFLAWYSDMCLRWFLGLCDAPFMLVWQWDGFIINPELWSKDFLEWDYVGAPMSSQHMLPKMDFLQSKLPDWKRPMIPIVGNGGFSLRSRRFLEVSSAMAGKGLSWGEEDFYLCLEKRDDMEKAGVRFAPLEVARRFSREDYGADYNRCFGFHDDENLGNLEKELDRRCLGPSSFVGSGEDKEKVLAIVCYPSVGLPDDWMRHHKRFTSFVAEASKEDEVNDRLKEAFSQGFKWGMVVRPEERLVADPGRLRSVLSDVLVPQAFLVRTDSDSREKVIIRLEKFHGYRRGQFVPKGMGGAGRWTSIEDVLSVDVLKDGVEVVTERRKDWAKMAVVFSHYRMPEKRLVDHFSWNEKLYMDAGATVFVVADREYDVPRYACCLKYPRPMPVFNISAASNYGIRFAIDCGYEAVLKTDADIVLDSSSWTKMLEVDDSRAISPAYYMAMDYETRKSNFFRNVIVCGVCCMTAGSWVKAHFHEGCWGYGHDDAVLLEAVKRAGILVDTIGGNPIWHMSHEGKGLKEYERGDFWNRSDFNPHNGANRRFLRNPVYQEPCWGLVGNDKKTYLFDARKDFPAGMNRFIAGNQGRIMDKRVIAMVPEDFMAGISSGIRCRVCDGGVNFLGDGEVVLLGPDDRLP